MDLQLDLSLSINPVKGSDPNQDRASSKKKRSFEEVFSGPTFPLLIRPESNRNAEKDDFVVGWPPVKFWRKQLSHHNRRVYATNYVNVENRGGGGRGGRRGSNYMYVKVKMEGVGIARKVDLSVHRSYRTLFAYLVALFGKCQEEYMLIYQNKEGDWLHARDVTWEIFIKSVQRLKLEKNGY